METVAWAMRVHSTNRQIQIDGIHLMSYMTQPVLLEIHGVVGDVVKGDVVIDLFVLIQNDTHNMLALVVRVINAHEDDYRLQLEATDLLHTYLHILNQLVWQPIPDFTVHEFESAILASMHRQLHSAGGWGAIDDSDSDVIGTYAYTSVQQNCIFVLEQLMQYDFAGMHRVADFMQYTINATMCNIWELAEDMERVYLNIMQRLDASGGATPLQMQRLQNIGASSGMMQISVSFMHNCMRAGTLRKANSNAHKMLLKICTGNAATTALMVQADVVRSIDEASQNVHQSGAWLAIREEVIALLRLGGGIGV
mmetsp:Transcript_73284/g.107591  ORF Transcript_73284/g.107591 Transcript_73284/m.107591 type:complete len:310 (-) Transcript_73284:51-980(-)